jgi:hypothetical protein
MHPTAVHAMQCNAAALWRPRSPPPFLSGRRIRSAAGGSDPLVEGWQSSSIRLADTIGRLLRYHTKPVAYRTPPVVMSPKARLYRDTCSKIKTSTQGNKNKTNHSQGEELQSAAAAAMPCRGSRLSVCLSVRRDLNWEVVVQYSAGAGKRSRGGQLKGKGPLNGGRRDG